MKSYGLPRSVYILLGALVISDILILVANHKLTAMSKKMEELDKKLSSIETLVKPVEKPTITLEPSKKHKTQEGYASWYGGNGDGFSGKKTANGEIFNPEEMTAAHKTLPLNSYVQVRNLENGRKIYVRINDRGPYIGNRVIDLSRKAAESLGFLEKGTAKVKIMVMAAGISPAMFIGKETNDNP